MSTIAVLGMGRMGTAMAEMVASDGHQVTVWNRTPDAAHEVARRLGCRFADTAAEAVAGAAVVLSVLADGPATTATLLDPDLLSALPEDSIICDMATSGPAAAVRIAAEFAARDRAFVDSPVAGSVASIRNRSLLVMASGPEQAVRDVTPLLTSFARTVVFLGEAGRGQAMKLSAGLVVHTLNSAVAEGLALAIRAGIDPSVAYDVFTSSSVGAPYLTYKRDTFLGSEAPVAMSLDLSGKDLGLIRSFADQCALELPVLAGVADEVAAARASGFGSSDMADVVRYLVSEPVPERPAP